MTPKERVLKTLARQEADRAPINYHSNPDRGYCFAPTHSLQNNSPTENVLAMYETAKNYGSYKK